MGMIKSFTYWILFVAQRQNKTGGFECNERAIFTSYEKFYEKFPYLLPGAWIDVPVCCMLGKTWI